MNFKDLKVGDFVIINDKFGKRLRNVKKITKTMVITEHQRFNINTGRLCNCDTWVNSFITIPTPSDILNLQYKSKCDYLREKILNKIKDYYNLDNLIKIATILDI